MSDKIAVIGAGIGGLSLAIALQQRGMDVNVYEQTAELDEIGAGLSLFANSIRLLDRMGVGEELATDASQPTELIYRHWLRGDRLASIPLGLQDTYRTKFGTPYYTVHRKHLQRCLLHRVAPNTIHLGKRLQDLSVGAGGVTLRWADGSESLANVVVAADGARSLVRGWMTGVESVRYSGTSGFRGIVPVEKLTKLENPEAVQFWTGPQRHLLHFPIGARGDAVNFLAAVDGPAEWSSEEWRQPTSRDEALAGYAGWHDAVLQMIGAVDHLERWGLFAVAPLATWSRGPVVLLGDAAHGMLPHHGQGANQAIEDAVALADLLAQPSSIPLESRLRSYEAMRKPRTERVQAASWETGEALHLDDGPQKAERNDLFKQFYDVRGWMDEYDVQNLRTG